MDDFITNLLNLPNTKVLNYELKDDKVNIHIESTVTKVPCRICGKETKPKGVCSESLNSI